MPGLPTGLRPIQLYSDVDLLDADLQHCRALDPVEAKFDCATWTDLDRLHDDLAAKLGLPSYYGRNLDALNELMGEVAVGNAGFAMGASTAIVVLRHFDRFHQRDPVTADALLDIIYRAAVDALIAGRALLCLVQSDDPALRPRPVGLTPVPWNRAERRRRV